MRLGSHFDAFTVSTSSGPHVTMQAGVVHAGRYWTTTTRHSVKAQLVRKQGRASFTTTDGDALRVVSGASTVLDPARPLSFVADPVSSALAGGALVRIGLGELEQLVGYVEAGRAVPARYLPTGRVLLVTHLDHEFVFDGSDIDTTIPPTTARPAWTLTEACGDLPDEIRDLVSAPGPCWLGVDTSVGPVALPATWQPGNGVIEVATALLETVGADPSGPICVTIDESTRRRPDEKLGVMLRGSGALLAHDKKTAAVALDFAFATYWCGFATTSTDEAA